MRRGRRKRMKRGAADRVHSIAKKSSSHLGVGTQRASLTQRVKLQRYVVRAIAVSERDGPGAEEASERAVRAVRVARPVLVRIGAAAIRSRRIDNLVWPFRLESHNFSALGRGRAVR